MVMDMPCGCRKSNPNIFVVQSAQDWRQRMRPALFTVRSRARLYPRPSACASHYSSNGLVPMPMARNRRVTTVP
jgi:hypothetical protein